MKKLTYKKKIFLVKKSRLRKPKKPENSRREHKDKFLLTMPHTVKAIDYKDRKILFALLNSADNALKEGKSLAINLKDIKELYPCGALIFLSFFDEWHIHYPSRISGSYPQNEAVEQVLQKFGVMTRLGLSDRKAITHDRAKFWHYISGSTVDARSYNDLALMVNRNIDHPEKELFADCLDEAVANSVGHAYNDESIISPRSSARKWWVVSSLKDDHIFVAIYDRGITIPKSLRDKPEWKDWLKGRKMKDASLIKTAVTSSRTRTRLSNRGKGLPEMLEFSRNMPSGDLSITSGNGSFRYDAATKEKKITRLKAYMFGTLVLWQIPLLQK